MGRSTDDPKNSTTYSCPRSLKDKFPELIELSRKLQIGDNISQLITHCLIEWYERNKQIFDSNNNSTNPVNVKYCNNNNVLTISQQKQQMPKSTDDVIMALKELVGGYMIDNRDNLTSNDFMILQANLLSTIKQLSDFAGKSYLKVRHQETLLKRSN